MNNPDDVRPFCLIVRVWSDKRHCNLDDLVRLQVKVSLSTSLDRSTWRSLSKGMTLSRVGLSLQDFKWTNTWNVENEISFCCVLENNLFDTWRTVFIILHWPVFEVKLEIVIQSLQSINWKFRFTCRGIQPECNDTQWPFSCRNSLFIIRINVLFSNLWMS